MRDVVMVAVITAFFTLCLAYVRWCDHIIGPDPTDRPDEVPATAELAGAFAAEEVSA